MAGGYVPTAAQKAADAAQMEQLRAILISSLDSVVKDNLPGATKIGRYWQADSIDGGNGTAFVVFADGGWSDFRDGAKHGDLLQLIAHHRFGGNVGEAIRWGKSHYGIDSMDPGRVKQVLAQAAADKAERSAKDEAEAKLFKKRAGHLWSGGVPIEGTPAEAYLIGRGIDLRPFGRGWPLSLRYIEECWCSIRQGKFPAMLAKIMGPDGFLACHRTYLDLTPVGDGPPVRIVKKIKLAEADRIDSKKPFDIWTPGDRRGGKVTSHKQTLGTYHPFGGSIPLWAGDAGTGLRDFPPRQVPWFGEGIENCLSRVMAFPGDWTGAAVSLANLGSVWVPETVDQVGLIMDHAEPGSPARVAQESAIARWQERLDHAEAVLLDLPKVGFKDHNDALRGISAQSNTLGQSK